MKTVLQNTRRGRGATENETGRYEKYTRDIYFDGWENQHLEQKIETQLIADRTKSILSYNASPDVPFDRSINAYRGCEHGCIYCFARPTHTYLGYSAGLDFESKIHFKPNAAPLLRKELSKSKYKVKPIAMGTNTDPYQPVEKQLKITRQILEFLYECRHPVTIVTKGSLIMRDLDILQKLAGHDLVKVGISVTTLDNGLHRKMEPRAASPTKRLQIISALKKAGIPTMTLIAPVIPKINDHELELILEKVREAGARDAKYILLRLPLEVAPLFKAWLEEHFPNRMKKVLKHIEDTREGRLNSSEFGLRMRGRGTYANIIQKRFDLAYRKVGFKDAAHKLRTDLFIKPNADERQLSLF